MPRKPSVYGAFLFPVVRCGVLPIVARWGCFRGYGRRNLGCRFQPTQNGAFHATHRHQGQTGDLHPQEGAAFARRTPGADVHKCPQLACSGRMSFNKLRNWDLRGLSLLQIACRTLSVSFVVQMGRPQSRRPSVSFAVQRNFLGGVIWAHHATR